jgi:hypothetical protein
MDAWYVNIFTLQLQLDMCLTQLLSFRKITDLYFAMIFLEG